jgi:hypothetical protein
MIRSLRHLRFFAANCPLIKREIHFRFCGISWEIARFLQNAGDSSKLTPEHGILTTKIRRCYHFRLRRASARQDWRDESQRTQRSGPRITRTNANFSHRWTQIFTDIEKIPGVLNFSVHDPHRRGGIRSIIHLTNSGLVQQLYLTPFDTPRRSAMQGGPRLRQGCVAVFIACALLNLVEESAVE